MMNWKIFRWNRPWPIRHTTPPSGCRDGGRSRNTRVKMAAVTLEIQTAPSL